MNSHSLERTIKRRMIEAFGMVAMKNVIELNIELNIVELIVIENIVIE